MPTTLVLDIGGHAGIEALGGLGWACLFFLCQHDHFSGRLSPLNRLVHSRAWRLGVLSLLAVASSAATVLLLDSGAAGAGVGVFVLAVAGHMIFEGLGGAIRAGLERAHRRFGLESRASRLAVLSVAYVLFAALCIQTVDRFLG